MISIENITLEGTDPAAAVAFYSAAFDLPPHVAFAASDDPTTGFRGFTLSLVVSQPADVDELFGSAVAAGATPLKPAKKGLWGYGGVVRAPDGTIWKVVTSSKRNTKQASRTIDNVVLLMGVADVSKSKRFFVERGLTVAKSFGRKYVEFTSTPGRITMALQSRAAVAKDAGVTPDGTGSSRLVISSDAGSFVDPDGFAWHVASSTAGVDA